MLFKKYKIIALVLPYILQPAEVATFPGGSPAKQEIPEQERAPGEGNGKPLQCSCLENSMDTGAWRATVYSVTKNWA